MLGIALIGLTVAGCGLGTEESFSPVITITSPQTQTVRGIVDFSANVLDDTGIEEVRFYADGVLLATDTEGPYQVMWNTLNGVADGNHTLRVEADDISGNSSSVSRVVTVSNSVPN
jgi:hypothetical protein